METWGKVLFLDIGECIVWNILEFISICLAACLIGTDSIWILFCVFSSYHIFWLLDMKHHERKISRKNYFHTLRALFCLLMSLSFPLRLCDTPVLKAQCWAWKMKQSPLTAQECLLDTTAGSLDWKCVNNKKIGDTLNLKKNKPWTKLTDK